MAHLYLRGFEVLKGCVTRWFLRGIESSLLLSPYRRRFFCIPSVCGGFAPRTSLSRRHEAADKREDLFVQSVTVISKSLEVMSRRRRRLRSRLNGPWSALILKKPSSLRARLAQCRYVMNHPMHDECRMVSTSGSTATETIVVYFRIFPHLPRLHHQSSIVTAV